MNLQEATDKLRKSIQDKFHVLRVLPLGNRILVAVSKMDESIPSTFEEYEVHQYKVPLSL